MLSGSDLQIEGGKPVIGSLNIGVNSGLPPLLVPRPGKLPPSDFPLPPSHFRLPPSAFPLPTSHFLMPPKLLLPVEHASQEVADNLEAGAFHQLFGHAAAVTGAAV